MYFAGDPLNGTNRLPQSAPEAKRGMRVFDFSAPSGQT